MGLCRLERPGNAVERRATLALASRQPKFDSESSGNGSGQPMRTTIRKSSPLADRFGFDCPSLSTMLCGDPRGTKSVQPSKSFCGDTFDQMPNIEENCRTPVFAAFQYEDDVAKSANHTP
jgi:hypothetical protein